MFEPGTVSPRSEARSCPLCKEGLPAQAGERQLYRCPACSTCYHLDCARELGACSVLGCVEQGAGVRARKAGKEVRRPSRTFWLLHALALVVVAVCAETEWLNQRAGGFLPRPAPTGNPKSRVMGAVMRNDWEAWLQAPWNVAIDETGMRVERPHTPQELERLRREFEEERAGYELHEWLRAICCWHYLLLPVVLIGLLAQVAKAPSLRQRASAGVFALLMLGCGALTLYRDYSTVYAS